MSHAFNDEVRGTGVTAPSVRERALSPVSHDSVSEGTAELEHVREILRELPAASSESECIRRIALLEDIKSATAAAQARETVAFVEFRLAREENEGINVERRGRGMGAEVALARRESPQSGSRALTMARVLHEDLPHASAALTDGKLSEFGAILVVKEVIALPSPARRVVDEEMKTRYGAVGLQRLSGEVRALGNQVDPSAQLKRHEIALSERRVTVRPAPDSMAYLTALLPLTQAFACKKALRDAAATQNYSGGTIPVSGAQAEADILVQRLTGQTTADAVPVELHVVMTDSAVFGTTRAEVMSAHSRNLGSVSRSSSTPSLSPAPPPNAASPAIDDDGREADPANSSAWIPGLGPLPAVIARDLLDPRRDDAGSEERVFLRRVFLDPHDGSIHAIDTRTRAFTGRLRRALLLRDDKCRTPWCNAPIVHLDHTHPYALGGRTSAVNGTGLCARCNYTKELPGWRHRKNPRDGALQVTTPTGEYYTSPVPSIIPQITVPRAADPPEP